MSSIADFLVITGGFLFCPIFIANERVMRTWSKSSLIIAFLGVLFAIAGCIVKVFFVPVGY